MRWQRRFIPMVVVLLAFLWPLLFPTVRALAQGEGPGEGTVIWNKNYTLEADERIEGDLVIINGDVYLKEGSRVEGSLIVWNGNAEIEGWVEGDVVVSGGDINLGETATVDGNVVCSLECTLTRAEGAEIGGSIFEGETPVPLPGLAWLEQWGVRVPFATPPNSMPGRWGDGGGLLGKIFRFAQGAATVLIVSVVAGLIALIWPQPVQQVAHTIERAPWPSLGIGVLVMLIAVVFIVGLAVTICLIPVAFLTALALGVAGLLGWIGVGTLLGKRLFSTQPGTEGEDVERRDAPLWITGLGTMLLTLAAVGLNALFCLAPFAWLLVCVAGGMGLGAVVLTRFGTQPYEQTGSAV